MQSYYSQSPNHPTIIQFLITSQQNCGIRSVYYNQPIVCCIDPVSNRPSLPLIRQPQMQQPQQPQQFQPQYNTQYNVQPEQPIKSIQNIPQNSFDKTCQDPNGIAGVCKSIKECPNILNEVLIKNNDQAYIRYIRQSNENCRRIQPLICCPFESQLAKTQNPSILEQNSNIQGRLLTPQEGCGLTDNVSVTKIVGGQNAKPGKFDELILIRKCIGQLL